MVTVLIAEGVVPRLAGSMTIRIGRRDLITALGGAAVAPILKPLAAYPQSNRKIPLVGYLWHAGSAEEEQPYYGAIVDGFTRMGYVDGRDIRLEHRFPDEKPELFKSMATELVALNPDVLMGGAITTSYLKDATTNIPIVFMFVPDPVGLKLVKSFAQPGGNVTGFVNFGRDLVGKRLQSLKEIVPNLSRVALLVNSEQPAARIYSEESRTVAAELGLSVQVFDVHVSEALETAFEEMLKANMQALITASGGSLFVWKAVIAKLALNYKLPYCAFSKETFDPGALMSVGADQVQMCRDSVVYVDKILKGAKPADLPVQQPTKLQFRLNLTAAKALGLSVPQSLYAIADEVIE
jgi:putative tryptophan/tyrosine transport system substrate-binding protein